MQCDNVTHSVFEYDRDDHSDYGRNDYDSEQEREADKSGENRDWCVAKAKEWAREEKEMKDEATVSGFCGAGICEEVKQIIYAHLHEPEVPEPTERDLMGVRTIYDM